MSSAASHLIGKHDFSSFRSSECQARTAIRDLRQISIQRYRSLVSFEFRADAYLHHMVRNIVGALVYVGSGKQPSAWLLELLDQRNRSLGAPTFSAAGLYLWQVTYPLDLLPVVENFRTMVAGFPLSQRP